jgi:hypothetical protein
MSDSNSLNLHPKDHLKTNLKQNSSIQIPIISDDHNENDININQQQPMPITSAAANSSAPPVSRKRK